MRYIEYDVKKRDSSTLLTYTQEIWNVEALIDNQNLSNEEKKDKIYDILEKLYNEAKKIGFNKCKNEIKCKIDNITFK